MKTLYIDDIRAVLPHRYPFLLVDRVVDISDDARTGTSIKNVTANEE
jgi:3-hydroxyacyl-[acyl-carrier-protein] dehydratase